MALAGQIQTDLSGNRRYAVRRPLRLATTVGASSADATIHDLSSTGMLLETAEEVALNDLLFVEIPSFGHVAATVVWSDGRFFGCKFDQPLSAAAVNGVVLRNPLFSPPPVLAAAEEQICIDSPPLSLEDAEIDELPVPSRLVLLSVMALAASAPVAAIAALV